VLNGIDHTAFRRDSSREAGIRAALGLDPSAYVIGAVGRLEPQKRFDLLVDAFASVPRRWPHLRLLAPGDGSLRATLQTQIDRLALGSACVLLGQRSDVADLHHAFDLF